LRRRYSRLAQAKGDFIQQTALKLRKRGMVSDADHPMLVHAKESWLA